MDYSLKKIVQLTIFLKVSLLSLIYLSYHYLPFNFENEKGNALGPILPFGFSSTLTTWDAQHYLFLADHGYAAGQMSNAFYPLLPFLMRLFGSLFLGNRLWTGLILSNGLTLFAVIFLYRLVRRDQDGKTAFYSCLFLLAFPTGFYLGLLYTESLFLFLSVALFYYMAEKKVGPALGCAALLPMSRPTGLLVLVSVLIGLASKEYFQGRDFKFLKWTLPLAFLAGYGLYLGWMGYATGDPFVAAHSQSYFITHYSLGRLFHPLDWFMGNFINIEFTINGVNTGILGRLLFAGYLVALIFARRRLNKTLFGYAVVLGLIPALSGDFASYMRYMVVLFPLFIVLAEKWKDKADYYLLICIPLQGLFCVAHALYNWVA